MSAFAKIAQATATGGGNFIKDGNYRFLVEKCSLSSRAQDNFVAELRVMESSPNGATDEQGRAIVPNAVGTSCCLVCNLVKVDNPGPSNARAFAEGVLGGLGYTPDQITEQLMMDICSAANPLRGAAVIDETYRGVNKGRTNPAHAGKPITKNKWKPVAQSLEDVKRQRAYLDSNVAKVDSTPVAIAQSPAPAAIVAQATPAAASGASTASGMLAGLGIK